MSFKEFKPINNHKGKKRGVAITERHKDLVRWFMKGGETMNSICLFTRLKLNNRDIKKIMAEPSREELESELNFIKSENGML